MSPILVFDDTGTTIATPTSTPTSSVQTPVELPHFAAPFAWTDTGAGVLEQDTPDEIAACVFNIASCPVAFLAHDPEFGIDDLSFATLPLDIDGLVADLDRQEPRASITAIDSPDGLDVTSRAVTVDVSPRGAGNG